ncbi:MAG: ABC transporter ATP-binding protein [Lachnospiraceae bacterium]
MIKRFYTFMEKYKKYALLSALCVVLETMFELIIPLIMADIIDVGVATGNQNYIISKGLQIIIYSLIALLLGIGYARFAALCGQGLGAEIRKAEYRKIQSFSFSNTDRFSTSSLVTRLTSDVTMIQNAVSGGIRPIVRAPVMMITALILSFTMNAKLAMIFMVTAPLLAVALYCIVTRVRPMYGRMQRVLDLVNRIIQENLIAIRVVKSYVRGDYEKEKFSEVNFELQTESEKAFKMASLNMPAMQVAMYATIICILWFGGNMIFQGQMLVGKLTGFLSYVLQILNSLMMISNVFMMLTRSMESGKRILEVMDEEPDIKDDRAEDISVEEGAIEFDHVYFKYKDEAEEFVLTDINLSIKPGETIGIIGGTGSAKTSLVQLIPRLYDVTAGEVRIDGKPVYQYPLAHLRDAVGVVLQKNTLFSGTIMDNLRWGKQNATEEEIKHACQIACADEFIDRFSDGYQTDLSQGGVNLSGGQKQRLCIARAILKQPKIIIFDDSTSAVDTATDAMIREGLEKYLPNMTKIIIAQRINSVKHADKIVIMEDGHIHAIGNHETLLQTNAIYQDIYHSQQEGVAL